MVRRTAFIGLIAAILGVAVAPSASYSAGTAKPDWVCPGGAAKCATVRVYVRLVGCGEVGPAPERSPASPLGGLHLHVARLGSGSSCTGAVACWRDILRNCFTGQHLLRLAPGRYGIATQYYTNSPATTLVLREGERRQVTLKIHRR